MTTANHGSAGPDTYELRAIVRPRAAVALTPLPVDAVTVGGFWAARRAVNRAALPVGGQRLTDAGSIPNLGAAAGATTSVPHGLSFRDSDVYKWLEALAWDGSLPGDLRDLTATIARAQRPDGYLNSVVQLTGARPYTHLGTSHEHYCAGHLFQAAVAQARTSGEHGLLDVARKFADHLAATFGPNGRSDLDGHPVVETALVELYRETGERRYLDLARHFVDTRGFGHATPPDGGFGTAGDPGRYVDHVPVREAETVDGHAVRAVYFATGATDVAIEDGDAGLLSAVRRQFDAMVRDKQHVTGGLGARWDGEAFGDAHELPPDRSYAETCAAVGALQWAWRLLVATGEARYADQVEHLLYNAILPGVSLDGTDFFYANTLQRRTGARPDAQRSPAHGRRPWFNVSCCPPNVMRTLASLPGYVATRSGDETQIHLYTPGTVRVGDRTVAIETAYPWDGRVTLTVDKATDLALRIPSWAAGATVDGAPAEPGTYAHRTVDDHTVLELPMPARLIEAGHRVDAVRGCVAVTRGPLVYALEQPDQEPGVVLEDLVIDAAADITSEHRQDLLGGVTVLHVRGWAVEPPAGEPYRPHGTLEPTRRPARLTLVPYYAWANRGRHAMRVWIPT